MKKRLLCLMLCLMLCMAGCAAMLERDYESLTPHEPVSAEEGASSALRVESYQDLVNAVLYLVSEGTEHGVLGLYNYTRDVEADLTAACLEVVQEDPLGAYAVDYIKHDYSLIVSYYEANIYITYRRTPEQVASITSVTGSSAIRRELGKTLSGFSSEAVLRVSYFAEDEEYIRSLVRQAYYDNPGTALGMPEMTVTLYPDSGVQRIVEIVLTWPEPVDALRRKSQELGEAAVARSPGLSDARSVYETVRQRVAPSQQGSTAYDALVGGAADSEGLALAVQLLCDQIPVTCTVVSGERDGQSWFWNIIDEGAGPFHVDAWTGIYGASDEQLSAAGSYVWDTAEYPACEGQKEDGEN